VPARVSVRIDGSHTVAGGIGRRWRRDRRTSCGTPARHTVQLTSSDVAATCYPAAAMPSDRPDADERAARIGVLLDDLHLTAEDLTELVKQAVRRVLQTVEHARAPATKKP